MENKLIGINQVTITGEIVSEFSYDHSILGEGFYMTDVKAIRGSGNCDIIPVMVSDRLLDMDTDYRGMFVTVDGQFRSYNRHEEDGNHLILSVFAREVEFVEGVENSTNNNQILLDGYVCKEPIYRKTPLGREVADILLAVNRPYGKTDYIPCICWSRNARFVSHLAIGQHIHVAGRIQSRFYIKKVSEEKYERKMAYEVSCSAVDLVDERSDDE